MNQATINTRIIQGISMLLCLCINILGSHTTIFSNTIGAISAMYPTPITPAPYTFFIWILIFIQWIYTFLWHKKSINSIEYILNALWVVVFCNNYIITSYCIILIMTFRMITLYKGYITYTTWLCVASSIQGYIVGGIVLFFFTVLAITIMASPITALAHAIDESRIASWNNKNWLSPLIPSLTAIGVLLWAIIGLIV